MTNIDAEVKLMLRERGYRPALGAYVVENDAIIWWFPVGLSIITGGEQLGAFVLTGIELMELCGERRKFKRYIRKKFDGKI